MNPEMVNVLIWQGGSHIGIGGSIFRKGWLSKCGLMALYHRNIHRALAAQDKIYPLNDALEVMDNLMALDTKSNSLDDAREYIKALAPWIKDDQIEYDSEMNPIGVSGAHTPFPPFHWKCRTISELVSL